VSLQIVERAGATDVGRHRSTNEDSYLESPPVFAVADGMGGARAGEVASRMAVEAFDDSNRDEDAPPEEQLAAVARAANSSIHRLAQEDESRAGMGTTFTAVMVDDGEVATGHVGDSRLYRLREGELERLTTDHSLVEELVKGGKISPESAENHPQRAIITRALGPEPDVKVDTFTSRGRDGDVYLLCSDGLTAMVPEQQLGDLLRASTSLQDGADALIAAANERGGKDNITVVLFRLGQDRGEAPESDTLSGQETGIDQIDAGEVRAAVAAAEGSRTVPGARSDPSATAVIDPVTATRARSARATEIRRIRPGADRQHDPADTPKGRPVLEHGVRRRGFARRSPIVAFLALLCIAAAGVGLYAGSRQFYFLGTNERGLVTLYRGVPYSAPFGLGLYTEEHTSTVPARNLPELQREAVLDHELRNRGDAVDLVRQLERTRGAG